MSLPLDTSGVVVLSIGPDQRAKTPVAWGNLSPFARSYTSALLASVGAGFANLAPETLERIIADCEGGCPATVEGGRRCWVDRQAGLWAAYPPLTVQLGDDGKVRFAALQAEQKGGA